MGGRDVESSYLSVVFLSISISVDAGSFSVTGSGSKNHSAEKSEPNVELYSTSWCGYCQKARVLFRQKGIRFVEYDIEKDREAANRKRQLDSKNGVPFAVINGHGIHGYSETLYIQALESIQ